MIKVISYGNKKKKFETAQIVIIGGGVSRTKHLWNINGVWMDVSGKSYNLK